jgi:hypothetical protein
VIVTAARVPALLRFLTLIVPVAPLKLPVPPVTFPLLSDQLSDDRGNRQRTPVDIDGRRKQFNHQSKHVRSARAFLIRKTSLVQGHIAPTPGITSPRLR